MTFSERSKTIALAIVHIFETAKPLGDYGAVAVLSDGAGFSVGINQFTHKSGSLAAVIDRFVKMGGDLPTLIEFALPDFRNGRNIAKRSSDAALKNAIKSLGTNEQWRQAQREIAFENYLSPALKACAGSGFKHPLSLAVIYDSINQGGYTTVRNKVSASDANEKAWITEFCADRKAWLKASKKPIVRTTVYRPNFFLEQIAKGNWNLDLPLTVNGHRLTESQLFKVSAAEPAGEKPDSLTENTPVVNPPGDGDKTISAEQPPTDTDKVAVEKETEPKTLFQKLKLKIAGWLAYFGGLETVQRWKADIDSLGVSVPVTAIKYMLLAGVGAFLIWLLYEGLDHLREKWAKRSLTNALVAANSTPTNKVMVVSPDNLNYFEEHGYTIIRRQ